MLPLSFQDGWTETIPHPSSRVKGSDCLTPSSGRCGGVERGVFLQNHTGSQSHLDSNTREEYNLGMRRFAWKERRGDIGRLLDWRRKTVSLFGGRFFRY